MMTKFGFRACTTAAATIAVLAVPTSFAADGLLRWIDAAGEVCEHHDGCLHGKLERAWWAQQGVALAWDEPTGRDMRNYPPDRIVDYQHIRIEMRFGDLNDKRFTATETLRFTPIGRPTSALNLHAVDLDIKSVQLNGDAAKIEHYHDGETLTVRFDPPLAMGETYELIFEYICEDPANGMFFTPACESVPHYTAEVHTQGQPETNRHWLIAHDFPNDMLTSELIVDVPAHLQVSSNGRLVSSDVQGDRAVWHWHQDKPHVIYLITLVIGEFDIVPIPHERIPMQVWSPKGLGDRVIPTYGRTGAMIDLFEKRFGVPYPWARYDQLIVKNFGSGGMENTAATTMYPTAILDDIALRDRDLDGLIAHELAHQWAGNLLTCKSWEHIWLNEGWATYSSALWFEERDGHDGYLDSMRRSFDVARRDRTTHDVPMASPIYREPFETFRRTANPYPKGASILHMLRMKLGEDVFWQGVHLYFNRHQHQPVETSDFRYALEEVSGLSLEWFFEQWCYRPGAPNLNVEIRYEPQERELIVDVEQTQHIDWRTPAFRFTLPVHVRMDSGAEKTFMLEVREKSATLRRVLDEIPEIVAVDPHMHVLKTISEQKPIRMWRAQAAAEGGPTIAARHAAIEAIGRHETSEHLDYLTNLIRDESERHTLRETAVSALQRFGSRDAKHALVSIMKDNPPRDPRVRLRLVEAVRNENRDDVMEILARIAADDESYATRAAAISALGRQKAKQHADLIAELVHVESQHDQVRNAALRALVEFDDPRGLDLAMQYAAYGHMDRARPTAIEVIGRLAKHDTDRAVEFLLSLLEDHERRSVNAAGTALARIGDERAKEPLEAMAQSHRHPAVRRSAEAWARDLGKAVRAEAEEAAVE